MLKCHSELFKSSVKLADGLRLSTKEELKDIAQLLLLSIPSKLRKEEYVSCLAEAVLTCPDIWISQLTHYEWLLLQKLVKAGANTYVEEPNMIMTSTLELLSFVAVECSLNGDKIRYMICDELREAVAPHIDKFLTSTEENSRFVLEQYALGILNLYGLLPYTEFLKQLTGYLKGSMTKDEIAKGLSNSMLMRQLTFDMEDIYNSVMYVRSPLLLDVEDLEERLYAHRAIKSLKKFTVEEVLSAGTMPVFYISNPHSDELKGFMMRKLGYNEELAEAKIQWLWYAIQMNENPMSAIVSAIDTKVLSMQELQEVVGIAVNYCNDCPRCANTCSKCDHDHIAVTNTAAFPHLAKCGNIRIISKFCCQSCQFFQLFLRILIFPAKICRTVNDSIYRNRSRHTDTNSKNLFFLNAMLL